MGVYFLAVSKYYDITWKPIEGYSWINKIISGLTGGLTVKLERNRDFTAMSCESPKIVG